MRERARALGAASYGSFDEMLDDPAAEIVHVTSPNQLHFGQVRDILAAGRHVVCEKPLAMTAAESGEMVRLAAASERVAAVCYNTRFYPLNQQARGMVAAESRKYTVLASPFEVLEGIRTWVYGVQPALSPFAMRPRRRPPPPPPDPLDGELFLYVLLGTCILAVIALVLRYRRNEA